VEGTVRRSVLFPGVHVGPGAVVEDSIVMHDARILPRASVARAIVDKSVRIGEGASVGGGDALPNREFPDDLANGFSVIGKGAEIPARCRIGGTTRVDIGALESDFPPTGLPPSSVVRARRVRHR
jgi:glucose-1-phosphate adenylyltransferase